MKTFHEKGRRAFTKVEGLVVAIAVSALLVLGILGFGKLRHRANNIHCVSFLVQIGIATRIWQGDHNGNYPMEVSVAKGGAQELLATGNVAACFEVMSNELATPFILACPNDVRSCAARDWNGQLSRTNISYFVGLAATNSVESTVLAGDNNLLQNGRDIPSGGINLHTNVLAWTADRHDSFANLLLPDGAVQSYQQMGFASSPGTLFATNRIIVP